MVKHFVIPVLFALFSITAELAFAASPPADACPASSIVPGYEFVRGKDLNGHIMKTFKGSVNDVAKECNKDTKCKAFNSWGQLKSSAGTGEDKKYWQKHNDGNWKSCRGMYIKKSKKKPTATKTTKRCPYLKPISGYEMKAYHDLGGYDMGRAKGSKDSTQAMVTEFARLCSKDRRCKSFNTWGFFKTTSSAKLIKKSDKKNCISLYIKKSTKKPSTAKKTDDNCSKVQVSGYEFVRGKDLNGYDIKRLTKGSIHDFAKACNKDTKCKSFNSWGFLKTSGDKKSKNWQKHKDGNWKSCRGLYIKKSKKKPTATKTTKRCPYLKPISGYEMKAYHDLGGYDMGRAKGSKDSTQAMVTEFARLCSKDRRCKSFNTWGFFKTTSSAKLIKKSDKKNCISLYIKKSTKKPSTAKKTDDNCSKVQVSGYEFVRGKDLNGSDIKRLTKGSIHDFAKACNKDTKCKSFNSWGFLKTSGDKKSKNWQKHKDGNWKSCRGLYIKKAIGTKKKTKKPVAVYDSKNACWCYD